MVKKADSKLIKRLNEVRLLNLIRYDSPITRIDLAKRSRISKVAVSEIINRLIEAGFVLEIGKGKSTRKGGKRPTLIKLNPDSAYVIGIQIEQQYSRIALGNIESQILEVKNFTYPAGSTVDDVLPRICRFIDRMISRHEIEPGKLVGIGIGIPGFIDYEKGEIHFADTLQGWAYFPIAKYFSSRYQVPVMLENDVKTIALGESLMGAGRNVSDFVCLWNGEGIGAGIVMNGNLVRGMNGTAGEIGYLEMGRSLVNIQRLKHLYKGKKQCCFGEILSETYLHQTLQKISGKSDRSLLKFLKDGDQGDEQVREILDEYALVLSVVCSLLIKVLNPSLLILSGTAIQNSSYLFDKVKELVRQDLKRIPFKSCDITTGALGEQAGLQGAIAMALQTIFESPVRVNHTYFVAD